MGNTRVGLRRLSPEEVERNFAVPCVIEDSVRVASDDHDSRRLELLNRSDDAAFEAVAVVSVLDAAYFADAYEAVPGHACQKVVVAEGGAANVAQRCYPEGLHPGSGQLVSVDVASPDGVWHTRPGTVVGRHDAREAAEPLEVAPGVVPEPFYHVVFSKKWTWQE